MARTFGLAIIPWSPLAGGFLTGKYRRGEPRTQGARLEQQSEWADKHFTDAAFDVLDTVQALALEKGCTVSQLALAWVTQQPGVTSPIVGPRTLEQFEDNLAALRVSITEEDRTRLDAVAPKGRAVVPYYNADFGPHLFRW
jgi:aryl-alcohol dehydrogenase-like predicted oxidoreductase